jgi:hypothetical protein
VKCVAPGFLSSVPIIRHDNFIHQSALTFNSIVTDNIDIAGAKLPLPHSRGTVIAFELAFSVA